MSVVKRALAVVCGLAAAFFIFGLLTSPPADGAVSTILVIVTGALAYAAYQLWPKRSRASVSAPATAREIDRRSTVRICVAVLMGFLLVWSMTRRGHDDAAVPRTPPSQPEASTPPSATASSLIAPSAPPTPSVPQTAPAPLSVPVSTPPIPPDQARFVAAIDRARAAYAAGANDMAKGAARPARGRELCAAVPGVVSGWIGTVSTLTTNGDGRGVLGVEIGDRIELKTWNNALSDAGDKTLIQPQSPLHEQAIRLRIGARVQVSGSLARGDVDCFRESSLTMDGSIRSPEFIFRFSSISPVP